MAQGESLRATPIRTEISFPHGSTVLRVASECERLVIHVAGPESHDTVEVRFERFVGYRVMDEGDIHEFWPACSTPNGWIFEIHAGGWLSWERQRKGSGLALHHDGLREFLITGDDDCVGVLAIDPPAITSGDRSLGPLPPGASN